MTERQRLPDLPLGPPPILQGLLEHISVDLGLDDLALLDLRKIDPPPALGANLLMIIGSARSEKHLHVSADRFCRWLRSTHKLSPYADGLLGRNELKLKMRRKARRSKLMANVGASETSNPDDGIRTGWVCVNIGRIEPAEGVKRSVPQREGFVGFGTQSDGVTVVVQMFTEEKRADIDLEGLWGGILRRNLKKDSKEESDTAVERQHPDAGYGEAYPSTTSTTSLPPRVSTSQTLHQIRSMHTFPRVRTSSLGCSGTPTTAKSQRRLQQSSSAGMMGEVSPARSLDASVPFFKNVLEKQVFRPAANLKGEAALRAAVTYLKGLSYDDARRELGPTDIQLSAFEADTVFMQYFVSQFPQWPQLTHWEAAFELSCYAIGLDHPHYSPSQLCAILNSISNSVDDVPERIYFETLKTIARQAHRRVSEGNLIQNQQILKSAFKILDNMYNRGYDVLSDEILLLMHKAVTPAVPLQQPDAATIIAEKQDKLRHHMDTFLVDLKDETSYLHVLRDYAVLGNWAGFWDLWQGRALHMYARTAEMYQLLFTAMARTEHQSRCIEALRKCVPQMEQEQPRVELKGGVAQAVLECLRVAEPQVERYAEGKAGVIQAEWIRLWNRCQRALNQDRR